MGFPCIYLYLITSPSNVRGCDALCYMLFRINREVEIHFLTIFGPFCYVVKIDFLSGEWDNLACCVVIKEFCIFDRVILAVEYDLIFGKRENSAAVFAGNRRSFTENWEFGKVCFQCRLYKGRFDRLSIPRVKRYGFGACFADISADTDTAPLLYG